MSGEKKPAIQLIEPLVSNLISKFHESSESAQGV
jgi:hypothetical protein